MTAGGGHIARMATSERAGLQHIALGTARLPKSMAGDGNAAVLLLEVVYDPADGRIVDIATSMALPGYRALLQRLLVGCTIDGAIPASSAVADHYRGPLAKATMAAIANAVANSHNSVVD